MSFEEGIKSNQYLISRFQVLLEPDIFVGNLWRLRLNWDNANKTNVKDNER
jgi:hypothetical protein